MTRATKPIPEGLHTITPQLTFDNAAQAIDWYKNALGAVEVSRSSAPDGKIMHAEIRIGDSHLYVNDAMGGSKSAKAMAGSPISLWVYVEDCDALFDRALAAGAKIDGPMGPMADQFWGDRVGMFADPFGYHWSIATRKFELTRDEMERRAAEFFRNQPHPTHA